MRVRILRYLMCVKSMSVGDSMEVDLTSVQYPYADI
jgi:hypothetical protein